MTPVIKQLTQAQFEA